MDKGKKAVLDMVQNENVVYLFDGDKLIEFIGEKVGFFEDNILLFEDEENRILNLDKLRNVEYEKKERNGNGWFTLYLSKEIYHNTNVYKIDRIVNSRYQHIFFHIITTL